MSDLDDTHQMIIVNAACHAIAMNRENEAYTQYCATRPHVILKAKMSKDGNQWCCLYGENLQEGVAGFGDTPAKAAASFDEAWEGRAEG